MRAWPQDKDQCPQVCAVINKGANGWIGGGEAGLLRGILFVSAAPLSPGEVECRWYTVPSFQGVDRGGRALNKGVEARHGGPGL